MSAEGELRQATASALKAGSSTGAVKPRPAMDPMAPLLTQPFKDLVGRGIIASISVRFSPMGTTVSGKASSKLVAVENSGLNTADEFPIATLLEVSRAGNLVTDPKAKKSGRGKVQQVKPAKSLVAEDMDTSITDAALQQRCNEVAKACGGGPLVGRVRSAGKFKGVVTTSYRQWWDAASAADRLLSLTEAKRREAFTAEGGGRMANIQCPFRGTLEFEVAADDDDEDGEPSTSA